MASIEVGDSEAQSLFDNQELVRYKERRSGGGDSAVVAIRTEDRLVT